MSHPVRAGLGAGVALGLALASLSSPAFASSSRPLQSSAAPPMSASHHSSAPSQGARPDSHFSPVDRAQAVRAARQERSRIATRLGLSKAQQLHVADVERDADATMHLRYTRTLGGLPVLGGDLVVHQSPSGRIIGADFATQQPLQLKTNVRTPISAARAAAISTKSPTSTAKPQKVVWAVSGIPRLAWLMTVRTGNAQGFPGRQHVVVDARTGRVIQRWSLEEPATGKGHSLYVGQVNIATTKTAGHYILQDSARGNARTVDVHNKFDPNGGYLKGTIFSDADNAWGNGKAANRQSAAVDVDYGVARTWDFYKSVFGRNGIANNGQGAKSRVHYGTGFDNAFWDDGCFCMTYGDGGTQFKPVVSLDVAGHEMSHGVTSRTAGLYYFGDSGGLNESTSDIMGTMVEFNAKNPRDPGDYYIGEKIMKPGNGGFLRRMDNPQLDGASYNCWSIGMGLDDPHFTSGPGNHFYYMLAEGSGPKVIGGRQHNAPVCNGAAAVQGVGRAKAEQIWYRALTRYFVSTTGYIDARDDTIHAAIDLYGANSAECKQVVKAWNAVAVPKQYWTCAGRLKEGKNTFGASKGFEPPNASWGHTGAAAVTKNPNVGLPRTGSWYGLLNYTGHVSNGTFTKQIHVPDSPTAMLRFYMLLSVYGSSGTVDVKINGTPIANGAGHFDESYADNTYIRWDIPVNPYRGRTVRLSIVGHEDAPYLSGGYFQGLLDDFTLTPR
jgi:Zn-dependent metalloprotease